MNRLLVLGALVLAGCTTTPTTTTPTATPDPSPTASATKTGAVTKVVDGDTFHVQQGGIDVTVRVLAIDTPETVDPRRPDGCFGQEASQQAHRLLDGKAVNLTPDPTQGDKDRYGRSLRYVQVDGKDYGLTMIEGGFAKAYKVSGPAPQRYADYVKAQEAAKATGKGLWGACPATAT